jgi:thioredoxin-like negative regulator of GroEL
MGTPMQNITDASQIDAILSDSGMKLFYLSRPDCGVCTAMKPKVRGMLEDFPRIDAYDIDLDELPVLAGRFEVFTIPAVLVYAEGKEFIREARYFSVDQLAGRINRYYELMYAPSETPLVDSTVDQQ